MLPLQNKVQINIDIIFINSAVQCSQLKICYMYNIKRSHIMIFQGLLNYRLSNSFKGWSWANPLLRTNSLYHGKLTAIFFLTLYPRVHRPCLFLVKRAKNHKQFPLTLKGKPHAG